MNRLIAISALAAGLISPFNPAHADPPKPAVVVVPSESCSRDLAVLPDFLLTNDTGAADNSRHRGESVIASALERATQEAASVKSSAECQQVLRRYLAAWREGHLYLQSLVQPMTVEPGVGSATQPSRQAQGGAGRGSLALPEDGTADLSHLQSIGGIRDP
jgi:hypothetical protein